MYFIATTGNTRAQATVTCPRHAASA